MNLRMKRLKKFYLSIPSKQEYDFTYYSLNNEDIATEFYYGSKGSVVVPNVLEGFNVKEVGNMTFSMGELKIEDFEKPDNRNNITNIVFKDGIEKI